MIRLVRILLAVGVAIGAAGGPAAAQQHCAGVVPGDPAWRSVTVYFDVGSSTLSEESRATIRRAADEIKRRFRDRVCLIGRTSPTGSREANERLAAARIRSVSEALVGHGVRRDIIQSLVQGPAFGLRVDRAENREDRSVMIMYPL